MEEVDRPTGLNVGTTLSMILPGCRMKHRECTKNYWN
jgi:hypothetical protein